MPEVAVSNTPYDDLQSMAVNLLRQRGEHMAAEALSRCTLTVTPDHTPLPASACICVELACPETLYPMLSAPSHPAAAAIRAAVRASLPDETWIERWLTCSQPSPDTPAVDASATHPATAQEPAIGAADNQAVDAANVKTWSNLRFRSESEIRIAQALDRASVLYFANCKARLGPPGQRVNREPDFLVCADGKWGILEVDGEPFHPASRAAEDHERDRLFRQYGIRLVEHFDARRCYDTPDMVASTFLALLRQA